MYPYLTFWEWSLSLGHTFEIVFRYLQMIHDGWCGNDDWCGVAMMAGVAIMADNGTL